MKWCDGQDCRVKLRKQMELPILDPAGGPWPRLKQCRLNLLSALQFPGTPGPSRTSFKHTQGRVLQHLWNISLAGFHCFILLVNGGRGNYTVSRMLICYLPHRLLQSPLRVFRILLSRTNITGINIKYACVIILNDCGKQALDFQVRSSLPFSS